MKGFHFRRQRPILGYIADFICLELKLIIEVDGFSHMWDETALRDERKERTFTSAGYTIIRYRDAEILNEIQRVQQEIEWWIEVWEEKSN